MHTVFKRFCTSSDKKDIPAIVEQQAEQEEQYQGHAS